MDFEQQKIVVPLNLYRQVPMRKTILIDLIKVFEMNQRNTHHWN